MTTGGAPRREGPVALSALFDEALQPVHLAGGALLMLGLSVNLFGARLLQRWRTRGA